MVSEEHFIIIISLLSKCRRHFLTMTNQTTKEKHATSRVLHASTLPHFLKFEHYCLFVCAEVLRPSKLNGVMSSAVSLPNHTFTGGRLSPLSG